jgi:hypothetical protein
MLRLNVDNLLLAVPGMTGPLPNPAGEPMAGSESQQFTGVGVGELPGRSFQEHQHLAARLACLHVGAEAQAVFAAQFAVVEHADARHVCTGSAARSAFVVGPIKRP